VPDPIEPSDGRPLPGPLSATRSVPAGIYKVQMPPSLTNR
jgi:hypothetical protein